VETAIVKLYKAILCYSGQIRNSQEPGVGRNLSNCFTAITGHPLTELKTSVEKERDDLRRWIELGGYLHHEKEAENLLLKIDELGESLKLLLEQSSLMHLHVVEGALYDCHIHEHEDFCLPGTRTELLSHITDWAKSDDKFIFWLNGMAGTGKSTIARTVAQGFKERGLLGASFFFKRGEADRGTATYLITSIAGQLVTRHRQLVPQVLNAIKTDPRITSKFLRDQFDQLLYRPLLKLQLDQSTTIVIIIDALDECDEDDDIKLILHLLFKLQEVQSVRLRVVLTSRPELPIRLGFLKEDNYEDIVLHELPAPVIQHDIRLFLEYKLSAIRREHSLPSDWPGNKKTEQLVQMALPLFIFAATLCRFIGDEDWLPEERLTAVLQDEATTSTSDMDRTYLPVLNQLLAAKNKKEFEQLIQEFQNIIGVIVLLATPLSVVSLAQLTGIPENKIINRLKRFHSVLSVPADLEAPVRIMHLSFRDFLIHTEGDFRINEEKTHRKIALNCLRIMDTRLRHNICDLASYGIKSKDIDRQIIQQHLAADLQYSCYYWVHHLKQSQGGISEYEILSFLQKRFLHWLEALALMGKISEAARMIKTLESNIWVCLRRFMDR
jgi:type II secretory pathway predicted ATPase ExeA